MNRENKNLVNKYRFNYSIILYKDAFTKNKTGYFVKLFWRDAKEVCKVEFLIKDNYVAEFDEKRNILTVPYNFRTKYCAEVVNADAKWNNTNKYEDTLFSEIFRIIADNNTKYPYELKTNREGQ